MPTFQQRWRALVFPLTAGMSANPQFHRASMFIVRADRWIQQRTRYRLSLVCLGGFHSVQLQVPGRKTGRITEISLLAIPDDEGGFLIGGSNFGRPKHPLWTLNLMDAPEVDGMLSGRPVRFRVTYLEGEARAAAWPLMCEQWPNYELYEARSGRRIRVFRITPQ